MAHRQKDPVRPLSTDGRAQLERLSRSHTGPAAHVARAKAALAVADGHPFTEAAYAAGRRSGDAVAQLVARFNRHGLAALEPGHGGGQPKRYTPAEQERMLREARRATDREAGGAATWSLSTLQRALRRAPDGLATVSASTIGCVLHEAGFAWGKDRSWRETRTAVHKRKGGTVTVTDPDGAAKKIDRSGLHPKPPAGVDGR